MYKQIAFEKISKTYYDGVDNGVCKGLKCTECGYVEFPPYPACNVCGHIGNEWVELSEVTVNEIYSISPMMTIPEFMPYAPLFSAAVKIPGGADISCLIFGVNRDNYIEMRERVPHKGKLVVMPMEGYNSFAVAINGATPVRKESTGPVMNQEEMIKKMAQKVESKGGNPEVDGVYNFVAKAMGRSNKGKLTIMADGDKLSGIMDIMDEAAEIKTGKLSGQNFEFTIEARGTEITFTGTIGGGKLSGAGKMGVIKMKLEGERE